MGAQARLRHIVARVRIAIDGRLPDRAVTRKVRGVPMVLPRRHLLPYFASEGTLYARNLVDLARELAAEGDLVVLDIGANVGDSALLILDQVPARIVCVEGDAQWLTYLERNVGHLDQVEIEASLLLTPEDTGNLQIVHEKVGSSRMIRVEDPSGLPFVSTEFLIERHPVLADVRLVKTDTDGFDVKLTPAVARALSGSKPVIFLEYDPRPTRLLTPDLEPASVWAKLEELGYEDALVWTNGGDLLGPATLSELAERSDMLEAEGAALPYAFWDVAVAHRDDAAGRRALAQLAGAPTVPWS